MRSPSTIHPHGPPNNTDYADVWAFVVGIERRKVAGVDATSACR